MHPPWEEPWIHISMEFVLCVPRHQRVMIISCWATDFPKWSISLQVRILMSMSVRLLFASLFFKEIVRKKLFESYKTWITKKALMKYSIKVGWVCILKSEPGVWEIFKKGENDVDHGRNFRANWACSVSKWSAVINLVLWIACCSWCSWILDFYAAASINLVLNLIVDNLDFLIENFKELVESHVELF